METALITWIIVAALAVLVIANAVIGKFHHHTGAKHHHRLNLIEVGNECDELYIPGDINSQHDSDIIEYEEEFESL